MELLDNELMFKVKQGDLDQMAQLYDRHHRKLFGFFCNQTGARDISEDMVQTVFMNMIRSRTTFTGSHKFETWMYTIARNILHDHRRKEGKRSSLMDGREMSEELPDTKSADTRLNEREEMDRLHNALQSLDPADRELIVLARYQELKYQEIAGLLKISEGAVKVRMHRALKQLREYFLKADQQIIVR